MKVGFKRALIAAPLLGHTVLYAAVTDSAAYNVAEKAARILALPPAPPYIAGTRAVAPQRAGVMPEAQAALLAATIDRETERYLDAQRRRNEPTRLAALGAPIWMAQQSDEDSLAPPQRDAPKPSERAKKPAPQDAKPQEEESLTPPERGGGKPAAGDQDAGQRPDAAAAPPQRGAQSESARTFPISGSLRGAYWSSSRTLDDERDFGAAALWLKSSGRPAGWLGLYAEGWARSDNLFQGSERKYQVREAFGDLTFGPVDVRLGRQIIVWGKADRINPTDNLTPRDFTLLVPEDDDNRFGALAAKARYSWSDFALSGVWLPEFRPNRIPLPSRQRVTLAPGIDLDTRPTYSEEVSNSHRSWAVKLEQSGRAFDWSVSYYDGFDLFPDLSLIGTTFSGGVPSPIVRLDHNVIRVLGADAAMTVGKFGLRAEATYTRTKDTDGKDPFVKNPFFYGVLGADRTFLEYLNVNLQYFVRYVENFEDPTAVPDPALRALALSQAVVNFQRDRTTHGVTLRVNYKWLRETLETELAAVWEHARRGYVIRPKAIYAISDKWKATLGADVFRGPEDSIFGRLRDNSTVFLELGYWF
jgi:hypothetical protein